MTCANENEICIGIAISHGSLNKVSVSNGSEAIDAKTRPVSHEGQPTAQYPAIASLQLSVVLSMASSATCYFTSWTLSDIPTSQVDQPVTIP